MEAFGYQLLLENTGITDCETGSGAEAAQKLLDHTLDEATRILGDDKKVDTVALTTQTGEDFYSEGLTGHCASGLRKRGVLFKEIFERVSFSNSQPVVAELAQKVIDGKGRGLFVAVEPLNCHPSDQRSKKIAERVLTGEREKLGTMLKGLEILILKFAEKFEIPRENVKEIARKIAIAFHQAKAGNKLAQNRKLVLESCYDDAANNRPVGEFLSLYDCCPTTSRGAAMVLTHADKLRETPNAVYFLGCLSRVDNRPMDERFRFDDYPHSEALFKATEVLFNNPVIQEQGITRARIMETGIIEMHNAIGPLVLLALIEMGFLKMEQVREGFMDFDLSKMNPSGGLFAGHPLAATYPSVMHFSRLQLLGQAGEDQIDGVDTALVQSIEGLRDGLSVSLVSR